MSPRVLNDGDRLEQLLAIVGTMPMMVPEAYSHQIDAILEHDTVSRLHHVRAATLVLAAAEDVLTPVYSARRSPRRSRGAAQGAPARRTRVQIEEPGAFNSAVLEFLAEQKNPDGHCGDAPPRR